jgi:hypothetical protein
LTCLAASFVLLGQYAGIKARESTKPAGAPPDAYGTYNSSASAVNAIFLIIVLFGINLIKAARPALYIPSIQFTIFTMIGFTYGPNEPSMHYSFLFVKELLYTFLTGQAISAGVSLLIIPVSSRKVFFAEATGLLRGFQGLLKAQLAFVETLEHSGPYTEESDSDKKVQYQQRSAALKAAFRGVLGLSAKIHVDVVYAERETAYGHFRSKDIHEFYRLLRSVVVPISSLSTIADISERLRRHKAFEKTKIQSDGENENFTNPLLVQSEHENTQRDWQELVHTLRNSFESAVHVFDEAVTHILILLKLVPMPKPKWTAKRTEIKTSDGVADNSDIEKGTSSPMPGDRKFGDHLEKEINDLRTSRTARLQEWAESRGLSSVFFSADDLGRKTTIDTLDDIDDPSLSRKERSIRQLNLVLYIEYLIYSVGVTTLALVRFAEAKVEDKTLTKKRIVFPKFSTVYKWMKGILFGNDSTAEIENIDKVPNKTEVIRLGDSYRGPRDPEHLPPKNAWQVYGDRMRAVPRFLSSEPVHFGVRVTIATMSVGIMAFLEQTHVFFVKQRVVWALIMITIGMKPTSGSAIFNLACNVIFTVGGMVTAFINVSPSFTSCFTQNS